QVTEMLPKPATSMHWRCSRDAPLPYIEQVTQPDSEVQPVRVMVISRSFAVCGFLAEVLGDEGYHVDAHRSAAEALAELRCGRHRLAIIDEALKEEVRLAD